MHHFELKIPWSETRLNGNKIIQMYIFAGTTFTFAKVEM